MTINTQSRVAGNLKALRKTSELSQQALSDKISISRSTYCHYEQGNKLPDVNTLCLLGQLYHITIDTLLNCDVQAVLSDHFLYAEYTQDERNLLRLYANLSDFSKGRLLERAEELARSDAHRRRQILRAHY